MKEKRAKMDDLISRQAAIEAILDLTDFGSVITLFEHVEEHDLQDNRLGGIIDAIDAVLLLPSTQPEVLACGEGELNTQGWIPCEERLPEESMWCLVTTVFGHIKMEYYRKAKPRQGGSYWRGSCKHPLAWMPLPEPYTEETT